MVKCALLQSELDDPRVIQEQYMDIMYETQALKCLENEDYICKVEDEIVEYDAQRNLIINYIVVVERA